MGRDGRGVRAATENTIEIFFMYKGERCRERIPLKPTTANLKRAEQHRSAIIYAISTGTFDYLTTFPNSKHAIKFNDSNDGSEKLEIYIEHWLVRKKTELKTSTFNGYRKIASQLTALLGNLKLTEIRKKHVRDALSIKEVSNKTLANIQSVLKAALDDAAEDELIETNPLAGWTYTKLAPPRTTEKIDPFSKEEQAIILAQSEGQNRNFIQFSLWTGLRTSELVALDWDDIDFVRGVVIINKALTQFSEVPESTKTASGCREVKLLAAALSALTDQKKYTFLKGKEIFQNPRYNERWTGDQPIRKTMFQPCLKKAGVRYRNPYQTRHTFASMMLSAGEHPMWVAKQMGHADWTMIARVYGKWMPDADKTAGSRAENIFWNSSLIPALAQN